MNTHQSAPLCRSRRARVLVTGLLSLLTACGSSDSSSNPPAATPAVAVAVSPASLSIPVGGNGSATATITRTGGFTSDATISATSGTAGVTVTVGTATLSGSASTSTIQVAVAGTVVAPATVPITISASGSGVTTATAVLTVTVTAAATPGATLTISAATATLQAKDTTATTLATVARTGGFAGDLTLSQTGAPAGVTVTFAPSPITAAATTSTISVRSSTTAAPGTYPIIISAAGTGITAPTVTYTLVVVAVPTLSVSVAPTSLAIVAGSNGSATATIVRGGGFTDVVAMTATGAPAGMTVGFTPASVAAGATTSAIAVTVGSGVAAGTYPITINAAGTGVTAAPATLTVNVSAVASGTTVTVSYCAADAPIWLAYQDGNGAWTRATPNAGTTTTYSFQIASGKLGVATVDTVGTGFNLGITYATTAEANGFGGAAQLGGCGTKTVNGTVANVSNTQFASVTLGYSSKFVIPIASSAFSLTNVAAGAQDLFAARINQSTSRADKLILRRGLNIADGGSLAVLDFNATEAFAPTSANVTISGLGADTANVISLFNGTRGSTFGLLGTISNYLAASGAKPFDAVPGAQISSGELQQLFATSNPAGNSNSERTTGVFFRSPVDVTLTLGPVLSSPTVTRIAGGAYSRVRAQVGAQTEYNRYFSADYSQTSIFRSTTITATSGYTGGGAWDLSIPDLSGATGWNPTWGLQNGTAITWSVTAQGGTVYLLDSTVSDGSTFKSAQVSSASPLP